MPSNSTASFSYDQLPYDSYPYANSHPRNLAALAKLFGMAPADVRCCRVLEIGSAAGGNLIPMAESFPNSEFLGVDASARQIEQGQQVIDEVSLDNIELIHQDILDFDPNAGKFDFVICHGVYSWVPADVQQKILSVCRDHLSENGIAYVSYNTYPGWYLRQGVREMMHYHASGFDDTQSKIDQSRALVDFLASAVKPQSDAYEKLLHEELHILRSSEDSYIFHEHLEEHNEPVFFHQFVERANKMQLRFLCEAQFSSMVANDYSEPTRKTLAKIAPNIIQMEQYLDFLRNRKFRQTLLCHRDITPDRSIKPERLHGLCVHSPLARRGSNDSEHQESESQDAGSVFDHASGQSLTVSNPIQKMAFQKLADAWPADVPIEELVDAVCQDSSGLAASPEECSPEECRREECRREECRRELQETFLELYSAGLVSLFAAASGCLATIADTPTVSPLARYQAARGNAITNRRHETVWVDEFEREIIQRLDGATTIDDLTSQLLELSVTIQTGEGDPPPEPVKPSHEELRRAIMVQLSRISQTALLGP